MSAEEPVILTGSKIVFYSSCDEDFFFKWLSSLKSVTSVKGRGNFLDITVDRATLDEAQLRELLALFFRYDIEMTQLSQFDDKRFSAWLRDNQTYWFDRVFSGT